MVYQINSHVLATAVLMYVCLTVTNTIFACVPYLTLQRGLAGLNIRGPTAHGNVW